MIKPRYRYNHKKKEFERLYRVDLDTIIVTGWKLPDGSYKTIRIRGGLNKEIIKRNESVIKRAKKFGFGAWV